MLDNFTEFISEMVEELSAFKEIISAAGLIIVDICALVISCLCAREKKTVQKQWSKASRHMVLMDYSGEFTFTLNSYEVLMGRHISADLRFSDMSVSRYHALLSLEDGIWTITDLDSTSGTFVNGQKVKQKKLRNNDEIKIGKKALYIRRVKA